MTSQTTSPAKQPAAGGKGGKGGKGPGRVGRSSLFLRESVAEMRKVIYPTRQELIQYTLVVLVFVTFVVVVVGALDWALTKLVLQVFG